MVSVIKKYSVVKYRGGKAHYMVLRDSAVFNAKSKIGIKKGNNFYTANASALLLIDPNFGEIEIYEKREPYEIVEVIYNPPATIVYFADGTKEVVKVAKGEVYDYYTGAHLCVMKKLLGKEKYDIMKKSLFSETKKSRKKHITDFLDRMFEKKEEKEEKPKSIRPIYKVNDILRCEKASRVSWEKLGEVRIVKELHVGYYGGIGYAMDNKAGICYKDQKNWVKIGEMKYGKDTAI